MVKKSRKLFRNVNTKKSTIKNTKKNTNRLKSKIVQTFMELLTMIKLYHWKTHSYSQHKATDELYEKLNENIDKFIEVLLGKSKNRVTMLENKMKMYDLEDKSELKEHIFEYRQFLIDLNHDFSATKDSDLFSIRDDILADLNQFLYLLSFDQP
jgi:DNA-binding ferritin-like protein